MVVLRKRYYWHIGNVLSLDKDGGYFAAGRTTKSMIKKYDEKSWNFIGEKLSDVDLEVNYHLAEG
jgi:hypothetical protein